MKNIKKALIKYGKLIYKERFVIGTGGNISARSYGKVYVKASRVSLKDSKMTDYNEVDLKTGKAICLKGPCSIEIPMHLSCYRARPDIGAVIHTHPVYGTIVGMMTSRIGYISYEFMAAFGSEVPTINYKRAGTPELAKSVEKVIKKHNGALLKNHGVIVVGKDLKEAYIRTLALERACKIYLFSKLGGKISFLPEDELRRLLRS